MMSNRFRDWLSCPNCDGDRDGDGDVSLLAHNVDIVLECYACGITAEFMIGDDTPFQNLRPDNGTHSVDSVTD